MTRFSVICLHSTSWTVFLACTTITISAEVSGVKTDDAGVNVHVIQSKYQAGETRISVLPPDGGDHPRPYRSLYVLPVEAGNGRHWGSAIEEVKEHCIHNKYGLVCVFPTFSDMPWYADHPSDPTIRQESYLLKVVIPFIQNNYPVVAEPEDRLLVGFSKSGWGAYSLLLRHPDVFGRAAAWDAPLTEDRPLRYGMGPIFGNRENFEQYRIFALLEKQANNLQGRPRLILTGYDNFRSHHLAAHRRMDELGISHVWRDGPNRKHHFNSGWLAEAVDLLARP